MILPPIVFLVVFCNRVFRGDGADSSQSFGGLLGKERNEVRGLEFAQSSFI